MIQRIQTIYLLLVIIISITLFFTPLAAITSVHDPLLPDAKISYMVKLYVITANIGDEVKTLNTPVLMMLPTLVIAILAGLTIFLYKDRRRQRQLCRFNLIVTCLLIAIIFYLIDRLKSSSEGHLTYLIGTYLPVIQLILIFLGDRAIKKDDDLVKSADRLR